VQVCAVTVGVVGDICRALDDKVLPFCDGIMTQLLKDLSSNQLHRSVKPPIFSCFGDIALAIGEHFEKYLIYAMPMLQGAAELTAQQAIRDEEMIDYNNQLRSGILEAYSGIFQGFKSNKAELMVPYAGHILQFIENVYQDKERYVCCCIVQEFPTIWNITVHYYTARSPCGYMPVQFSAPHFELRDGGRGQRLKFTWCMCTVLSSSAVCTLALHFPLSFRPALMLRHFLSVCLSSDSDFC